MKKLLFLLFIGISSYGFGQQLVYTPKNPAEGLEGFDSLLNNQLFGQFGDQELPPEGTSRDGNLEYEVFESTEGLVINILDITTGEQTQIIVPNN